MRKAMWLAAGTVTALAGCVAQPNATSESAIEAREYRTGSNVSRRQPASEVRVFDRDAIERGGDVSTPGPTPGPGGS